MGQWDVGPVQNMEFESTQMISSFFLCFWGIFEERPSQPAGLDQTVRYR